MGVVFIAAFFKFMPQRFEKLKPESIRQYKKQFCHSVIDV